MIKEIIKKVKLVLFRWKLERNNFYEDITIVKKKIITRRGEKEKTKHVRKIAKKVIAEWMFNIQEEDGVKIRKLKYLFDELNEIVFPIKICDVSIERYGRLIDIDFIDYEEKKYYMSKTNYFYDTGINYTIGRRNSKLEPLVDRNFNYKISKDKRIKLIETGVMRLKLDGSNDDITIDFSYDYDRYTTTVKLSSFKSLKMIEIEYLGKEEQLEKNLLKFLFDNNDEESYYCDSLQILKWLVSQIYNKENLLSIETKTESKSQVVIGSEIKMKDGIVNKYTYTKIINEEEIQIIQNIFAKELDQFLEEN